MSQSRNITLEIYYIFTKLKSKSFVLKPSVEYLGHVIDAMGLHPRMEKVKAIQDALKPKNVTELRSFLRIIIYYSQVLPNLSVQLAPMHTLLHKQSR